jgi:predicted ATPase
MSSSKLPLQSFRLKNFKAVRDSGTIRFTPLTVLIGNNGSGKSSLIEGLEMFQQIVLQGIDEAIQPWRGFEHVWNKAVEHKLQKNNKVSNPMSFEIKGSFRHGLVMDIPVCVDLSLEMDHEKNTVSIKEHKVKSPEEGPPAGLMGNSFPEYRISGDKRLQMMTSAWQFFTILPQNMQYPVLQKRTKGGVGLSRDGANVAEYFESIRNADVSVFHDIIETMQSVLPYADDLQPAITSELERSVYLTLKEKGIADKLPGWLLSQGTLRILALLCLLRHPQPPSVIIIEEIENGLDPRTIHLLVEEIRAFVQSGKGQIIATTHSPYLLDLLPLSQIIVVERDAENSPAFTRPIDNSDLADWAAKFAPGKLYTMGKLTRS